MTARSTRATRSRPTRCGPAGGWQEVFNSDAAIYGGDNAGNCGAILSVDGGRIQANIPAHGFIVLQKVS